MTHEYWRANRWDLVKPNATVVVHPFDGEIYAQLTNLSTSYEVFVHGAMEAPDISKKKLIYPETDYTVYEFPAMFINYESRQLMVKIYSSTTIHACTMYSYVRLLSLWHWKF